MVAAILGYRHHRPNLPQRVVRWAGGTHLGAWLLSKSLRRIDGVVLSLTSGRRTFTSFAAGLPVIVLVTTGARSGERRPSTVLGIPLGDALAVAGGDFGQRTTPAWTCNLAAHPRAVVEYGGRAIAVTARAVTDAERATALSSAAEVFAPFANYVHWASRRDLSVFVLELGAR